MEHKHNSSAAAQKQDASDSQSLPRSLMWEANGEKSGIVQVSDGEFTPTIIQIAHIWLAWILDGVQNNV